MADTNNETSPAPAALVVKGIPVGVPVPVDAELDPDSDNPVSNKAVSEKFNEINTHLSDKADVLDTFEELVNSTDYTHWKVVNLPSGKKLSDYSAFILSLANTGDIDYGSIMIPKARLLEYNATTKYISGFVAFSSSLVAQYGVYYINDTSVALYVGNAGTTIRVRLTGCK